MSNEDIKVINELHEKFEQYFQAGDYENATKLIDSVIKNDKATTLAGSNKKRV